MKRNSPYNLLLSLFLLFSLFSCMGTENEKKKETKEETITAETLKVDRNGLSNSSITIKTIHGNVTFKLYPQKAPNTVTRIITLVNKGFYDGLKFHRVVPSFVIQAGDPTGTGSGGSGKKLKSEFNDIQHVKGTVAMARTNDPDSADSQFYIALNTLSHLDGKYTIFGQVIEGLDVIDKIKQGDLIISMVFNRK